MTESQKQLFLELLEPLYTRVERYALTLTRDRVAARELLCDTVSMAYEGFERLQDHQAFLSFLFSIALRQWRKRQQQFARHDHLSADAIDELFAGGARPDQCLELQELYQALDKLPTAYRELLILAEIVGLSHKEIQAVTDLSIATIKVRIFRAKQKLKGIIEKSEWNVPDTASTAEHHQQPNASVDSTDNNFLKNSVDTTLA